LTDAIIRGDLELCQRLVERGFYIDGTCECGCTPLLKAYAHNRREIASYLLTIGASVEGLTCDGEYDNVGFSALHCAASMGDEKILEAIIERASYITEKGPQAFRIAACLGHVKILQLLFSHMDDPKSLLEARSDGTAAVKNYDRLYWASQIGTEIGQGTSLHFAAMYNRIEAVEFLLRAGADLEARDEEGLTALQHSIERCDSTDVTELLVSAGANISTRDREGLTPLMRAARRGTLASLKIILSKYDEEVLHARDRWGKTALHHAIEDCQLSAAKELVKLGAQVNILDYAGISPLQSAIVNHQSQFVLENLPRIDTYFSERYGSLLNMAVSRKNTEVVMELLKRVPDEKMDRYVNLNCELGTPLYASASLGNISIMEELLAKGAMVNIVGGPLGTPLMGACEMDQMEAVSFLLKKGAKLECVKPNGAKITAEQAARKNDYTQLILQRFKEKGGEAFDEKIPTKKADVEKMDETLRILKERKEERRNQIVISDSDTDSNTDSDGNDNTDGDTGDEKAGDGKTDEEKDLEKDLEKDE
jgi:ankyrin repeat protein